MRRVTLLAVCDALAPSRGNGDGVINPGEKTELTISVKNRGGQNAGPIRAVLSTSDPHVVSFPVSEVGFTSIPRWGVSESLTPAVFEVAADTPVPHFIPLHRYAKWDEVCRDLGTGFRFSS